MKKIFGPLHDAVLSFGAIDIFDYLSLSGEWTSEQAQEALTTKRRWAQGQRSNPKFSDESTWFIKNSMEISEILKNPTGYQDFVLNISDDQTEEAFVDHYANLGVSPSASLNEIMLAHRERYRQTRTRLQSDDSHNEYRILDDAWACLSDPQTRSTYDVKHRMTAGTGIGWNSLDGHERRAEGLLGPHDGQRLHLPFKFSGKEELRRQVRSGPHYQFNKTSVKMFITNTPSKITLTVRKSDAAQQPARLFTDSRWLRASPTHLDPAANTQTITLISSPRFMTSNRALAKLVLETADKQRTTVSVIGRRARFSNFSKWLLALAVLCFTLSMFWVTTTLQSTELESELELIVTPSNATIYLDGENIGQGTPRTITGIPHDTPLSITVEAPDFETWRQRVIVNEGEAKTVEIFLQRAEE